METVTLDNVEQSAIEAKIASYTEQHTQAIAELQRWAVNVQRLEGAIAGLKELLK